jgi:hypothetical protein
LNDWKITLSTDSHDQFCMNYHPMRRRFLRTDTEI